MSSSASPTFDNAAATPAPAWTIVALITIGLLVDQHVQPWGQDVVSIITWTMLLYWLARSTPDTRTSMILCVAYATAGEIFLSLGWGLYEYRLHNIPLFVPPAHALVFVLGIAISKRMPDSIIWAVPLAAAPPVIALAWIGADTMGLILYTLLLLCMIFSRGRKLYAVMFMLSLGLEIYGTAIGNWFWLHDVPVTGWTTLNPPLAAGTFYCMLDMLVVTTMNARQRRSNPQLQTG
jgi:xanthosine utilization system XapX-like protein